MKNLAKYVSLTISLTFFFFLPKQSGAQQTIVYGNISAATGTRLNPSDIYISYDGTDSICENAYMAGERIDSNQNYHIAFDHFNQIKISIDDEEYYKTVNRAYTSDLDSIRMDFVLYPKEYYLSKNKAKEDISQNIYRLYTYNKHRKKLANDTNFINKYKFNYEVIDKPLGKEMREFIREYNSTVLKHLYPKQYYLIEETFYDSLKYYAADDFFKKNKHKIDDYNRIIYGHLVTERIIKTQKKHNYIPDHSLSKSKKKEISLLPLDSIYSIFLSGEKSDDISIVSFWASINDNYLKIIPKLINSIMDTTYVKLSQSGHGYVYDRAAKDEKHTYHDHPILDDLYTVSGRANSLLKELSGINDIGFVRIFSTKKDLEKLRGRWIYWLWNCQK